MSLYTFIKPELSYFLKSLENYNEIPFNKKNKKSGISVGFIYKTLCQNFNLEIIHNINECLEGNSKSTKGKTFKGVSHFLMKKGSVSSKKKMSEKFNEATFIKPSMIKDELYRIMKEMERLGNLIQKANKKELKQSKVKHDSLGHLSANEWYKLGMYNIKKIKKIKSQLDKELSKG